MNSNEEWTSCPTGMLRRLKDDFTVQSHTRSMQPVLAGVGAVVLIGAILLGFRLLGGSDGNAPSHLPHGMVCQDVKPLLQRYHQGELNEELASRVAEHIGYCRRCSEYYHEHFVDATAHRELPDWSSLLLAENR